MAGVQRALEVVHQQNTATWEQHATLLAQVAAGLGVEASERVPAAPWVITGVVDGRAFYMRERWDQYSVVIAPDDQPGLDIWSAVDVPGITVREGGIRELVAPDGTVDYRVVLPVVVSAVRVELLRRTCPHPSNAGDAYCVRCGSALDAEDFIRSVDPRTMRPGGRLSAVAASWARCSRAEDDLVARVAAARAAGDSWRMIATVLDLTVKQTRERFRREVGE